MRRRLGFGALLGLIMLSAFVMGSQEAASVSSRCAGLTGYRADILAALSDDQYIITGLPPDGDIDKVTPEQWRARADNAWMLNALLKHISPPVFATEWHDVYIDRNDLVERAARAVAADGLGVASAFQAEIDAVEARTAAAAEHGTQLCRAFGDFITELSGDER
jgi:hypothetical protein